MPSAIEAQLRDGTSVVLRPIGPDDRHLIEVGLERLSDRSRYFRFMHPVNKISDEDMDRFSDVDQMNHIAWGALCVGEQLEPLGLARCVRVSSNEHVAEVAVAVVDSHQGLGLGTMLLAAIAYDACQKGVSEFAATVLPDNRKMLDLFDELAARRRMDGGVVAVRIPIFMDAACYPSTPTGDAFRAVYSLFEAP